ncbi:hypothetical protein Tcan_18153 [Toxocara canis]|uniref:Uncharacterized protein n=1 Tax=Toxocara canis TaxID=6265 RepID=A0A0B2VK03_TOXCA|nr:hypothetical protein Tcan_18153 [Toxocara canis]
MFAGIGCLGGGFSDEFDILASELKNRLRRSILQIQCSAGEADSVNNDQKVRLVLNVQLHKHTSVKKHRPMEYIWEERMVVPECKVMKPYGERIVSKLVQLSILRYAGEHTEDEYEDIDSNRLMHR